MGDTTKMNPWCSWAMFSPPTQNHPNDKIWQLWLDLDETTWGSLFLGK